MGQAMRGIPIAHARWIGLLLAEVSDQQLRDAFNAAGYSENVRDSYISALRERINQLRQLPTRTQRHQSSEGFTERITRLNSNAVKQARTSVVNAFSKVGSAIKGN